jgi:hypothetical protein
VILTKRDRPRVAAVAGAAMVLLLAGCGPVEPRPGSVMIQIQVGEYPNAQTEFSVRVHDGNGDLVYDAVLQRGYNIVVEDVAPGDVRVTIENLCEVEAAVDGNTLQATVEPGQCILASGADPSEPE